MTDTTEGLERLRELSRAVKENQTTTQMLRERRFRVIEELVGAGLPVAEVARAAGVTRVTLHQQLKARRERRGAAGR